MRLIEFSEEVILSTSISMTDPTTVFIFNVMKSSSSMTLDIAAV